jgi:hypothetical protein
MKPCLNVEKALVDAMRLAGGMSGIKRKNTE